MNAVRWLCLVYVWNTIHFAVGRSEFWYVILPATNREENGVLCIVLKPRLQRLLAYTYNLVKGAGY